MTASQRAPAADAPPAARTPAAIFVNEAAGSARSERVQLTIALVQQRLRAEVHTTATRVPAELSAWMAARVGGYRTVVIAGGDGSLGVAYNVLAGTDTVIGYIPAGFGNATAHLLRLPREPGSLAALICTAPARPIDLVAADGRLALFVGIGWDAAVAGRYAREGARGLLGWARAIAESVPETWHRRRVEVVADGELVHAGPMELLVAGTTPYYGRGMRVNPGARPDRGRFVLRVYPGPMPRLAAEAVRWLAGRRPAAPGVEALVAEIRAVDGRPLPLQADGDLLGEALSWHLEIRPAATRLIGRGSG